MDRSFHGWYTDTLHKSSIGLDNNLPNGIPASVEKEKGESENKNCTSIKGYRQTSCLNFDLLHLT